MTGEVHPDWIVPDWDVPARVRAIVTTRAGGVSTGPYLGLNLGRSTGDDPEHVNRNRELLRAAVPAELRWLRQAHGATVVDAAQVAAPVEADASYAVEPNVLCVVSVADCLPVFLADRQGRAVAVAHAGWRGLAAGVLQATAHALRARLGEADARVQAWVGPGIGPAHFEVGADVLDAMERTLARAREAFAPVAGGKFRADLPALARQALAQVGVTDVGGGTLCTYSEPSRFYSFRRDRITGRHAAVIWLAAVV